MAPSVSMAQLSDGTTADLVLDLENAIAEMERAERVARAQEVRARLVEAARRDASALRRRLERDAAAALEPAQP